MKPVIIIAIAFVLLIPTAVFAQEEFVSAEFNDLQNDVEELKENRLLAHILTGIGLLFEVIGVALVAIYWNKNVHHDILDKWIPSNLPLLSSIDPPTAKDRKHASSLYVDKVVNGQRITYYYELPNEFKYNWWVRTKIRSIFFVILGLAFQLSSILF